MLLFHKAALNLSKSTVKKITMLENVYLSNKFWKTKLNIIVDILIIFEIN